MQQKNMMEQFSSGGEMKHVLFLLIFLIKAFLITRQLIMFFDTKEIKTKIHLKCINRTETKKRNERVSFKN